MNGAYAPPLRAPASLCGRRDTGWGTEPGKSTAWASLCGRRDTGRQQESCRSAALLGLCGRAASAPGDCRIKFVV